MYVDGIGQIVLAEYEHANVKLMKELVPRSAIQTKTMAGQFDVQLMKVIPAKQTFGFGKDVRDAVYEISGTPGLRPVLDHSSRQAAKVADNGIVQVAVKAPELAPVRLHKRVDHKYLKASKILDFHDTTISLSLIHI